MGGERRGSASTLQHSDNATGVSIDSGRKVKLLTWEEGRLERHAQSQRGRVCVSLRGRR